MAAGKSYVNLGIFVIVVVVVAIGTALFFVQRMRSRETIAMVTYVTENVSGLEISSPVRYRGVSVGRVTDLRVDPAGLMIEVAFEVFVDRLSTIGANVEEIRRMSSLPVFPRLRSRLVSNPVTGEAYLLLDVPENPPPPLVLGFTPDRPYVPSMPSPLATVQDRLPEVLERVEGTMQVLTEIIGRVPGSLDRSDRFFTNVERILQESALPALSADLRSFATSGTAQLGHVAEATDRLLASSETIAAATVDASRAIREANLSDSMRAAREAADRSSIAADDLRRALPAIRDALTDVRDVARRLEEQPESVVYGPRRRREPQR